MATENNVLTKNYDMVVVYLYLLLYNNGKNTDNNKTRSKHIGDYRKGC